MKYIITPFVAIVCIVMGSIGGHFLKSRPVSQVDASSHNIESGSSSHGEEEGEHSSQPTSKSDHGSATHGSSDLSDIVYYKFSREFVVPIIEGGSVKALVILNINLEADAAISQELYSMEPKIRDNIMTTMIKLSNEGSTFDSITDVESYESIRATILNNVRNVIPTGIRNVLILDVARQDL